MALKGQLPPRKQNNEFNSSDMNQMIAPILIIGTQILRQFV